MTIEAQLNDLLPICQILLNEGAKFDTTGPIATEQVRNIYRLRAQHNHKRDKPFAGFDALLEGLDQFEGDEVRIHGFTKPSEMLVVFTDASIKEVIGTLTKSSAETSTKIRPLSTVTAQH